jgi:uroporphyrinogen decarboxylase
MATMTSRERVLAAVTHRQPDKVPKDISWGLTRAAMEMFRAHTGRDDPQDYFGLDVRFVGLGVPPAFEEREVARRQAVFGPYLGDLPVDAEITEWGTGHVQSPNSDYYSYVKPLAGFQSIDQLKSYPFPTFDEDWRRDWARRQIADFHGRDLAVGGALAVTLFETVWQLRGMEQLFVDFRFDPEFAAYLLDRMTDIRCAQARFLAHQGVDVLVLGDDISMQTGMMMSLPMWRTWFKGRMARIIAEARAVKPGLPVFYHTDGNPEAVIPELIEIGITILNPVQPECIDPVMVKRRYGDRLALWGTIGIQTTLPFGTPDDVRQEVKTRIETLGAGGGLVLGPTHVVEADVPWENLVALYEAIETYGAYR